MTKSQGKVDWATSNLYDMMIQKLEKLRKHAFAVYGVYGVEGAYVIQGVWLLRGLDFPDELKEYEAFPYLDKEKLSESSEKDRATINEFWSKMNEGDMVNGRPVFKTEYFS